MTEPWSVRIRRLMNAMGWPEGLMALKLGLRSRESVVRLLRGGRPAINVLLRLQELELTHAAEIEKQRANAARRIKPAYLWPPIWVGCLQRWWVEPRAQRVPARPADLAAMGANRTDPATVLTGRLDARNYPGRTLRLVDWTPAGRRKYAENITAEARRHAPKPRRSGSPFKKRNDGKEQAQ